MSRHPYRSVLYIPASKERALQKATTLRTDAIIFDLEDAVAPTEKEIARDLLVQTLRAGGYGRRAQLVRINGFDTPWGQEDFAHVAQAAPGAIVLPKVNSLADIVDLSRKLDAQPETADTKIWAMMETPLGILNAQEIASGPRMAGLIMGTNDLAKDLTTRPRADRAPMMTALQHCVLAARAAGIVAVDGVFNAFKDDDGLRIECNQGRDLGFDGKTLIHPAQLDIANEVFAPTEADIALAHRQITAFMEATSRREGIAVLDGQIVENLHVETARATLAKVNAIAALEG